MGEKRYNDIIRPRSWSEALTREGFRELERLKTGQDWYSVYRLDEETLIISEDGQFEENVNYLVTGSDRAALIDTGDDLGDIREPAPFGSKTSSTTVSWTGSYCYGYFSRPSGVKSRIGSLPFPVNNC